MRQLIVLTALFSALPACTTTRPALPPGVEPWQVAEDRRDPDPTVFAPALSDPRAVRALGRLGSPALLPQLEAALTDRKTRAIAAWGLGQLGLADGFDPALAAPQVERLRSYIKDMDPSVRAAVALALGRLRDEAWARDLLDDPDAPVRAAALTGLFWCSYLAKAGLADDTVAAILPLADDTDPAVRRALALVFSRRAEPRAETVLTRLAVEGPLETSILAIRALGKLDAPSPSTTELLARLVAAASTPRDARIEAILGIKDVARLPPTLADDDSPAVRAAFASRTGTVSATETSGWVRALAVGTEAKKSFSRKALEDPDPRVRAAAAEAIGSAGKAWRPAFDRAWKDDDLGVRLAALGALADVEGKPGDTFLAKLLPKLPKEPTLRGAAAEAAAGRKAKALAKPLAALAADSPEPEYVEMRETIADALAAAEAWDLLAKMASDPAPSVRMRVARAQAEHEKRPMPEVDRRLPEPGPYLGAPAAERLVLETPRGPVVIALDRERAPTTAAAITALAQKGFYDSTIWHRLVPNFVVQGGDPTGTGWGDAGFQLRDEVSELPFDTGTVGLAKAGPDTGSCQLFITLGPAPHLEGRYTIVGHVVSGMDAVRALERGDKITRATAE